MDFIRGIDWIVALSWTMVFVLSFPALRNVALALVRKEGLLRVLGDAVVFVLVFFGGVYLVVKYIEFKNGG